METAFHTNNNVNKTASDMTNGFICFNSKVKKIIRSICYNDIKFKITVSFPSAKKPSKYIFLDESFATN